MLQNLNILLQYVLPHHAISRFVGWITRIRWRPFRKAFTSVFVAIYKPDLSDAVEPDPHAYEHFNAFFTRALKPGARPLAGDAGTLVSPVDGTMSQSGSIERNQILQAKGWNYTLEALLAGAAQEWAPRFTHGRFATIYLAPYNYHRIHMPADGTLRAAWYVPGRLFSVSALAARKVHDLFARNERVVLLFEGSHGPFAVILVGALNVGSMATVWHGDVTPRRPRVASLLPLPPPQQCFLARGEELGRFNMGSTVILLFGPGVAELERIDSGATLRLGQRLGRLGTARP
jgi:phosphatidylserine decarboxylase